MPPMTQESTSPPENSVHFPPLKPAPVALPLQQEVPSMVSPIEFDRACRSAPTNQFLLQRACQGLADTSPRALSLMAAPYYAFSGEFARSCLPPTAQPEMCLIQKRASLMLISQHHFVPKAYPSHCYNAFHPARVSYRQHQNLSSGSGENQP